MIINAEFNEVNKVLNADFGLLTRGEKGEKGDAFTYEDFTEEQLASLKGEDGEVTTEQLNNTFEQIADVVSGKNLFDFSKGQVNVRFDDNGNIVGNAGSTVGITDYIPVTSGDIVKASYKTADGVRNNLSMRRIIGYDANKNCVGLVGSYAHLYVVSAGISYIRAQCPSFSADSEIQIELAYDATEYKPYKEKLILKDNRLLTIENNTYCVGRYCSDMTVVGNRIWAFFESTAIGQMDGSIDIMNFNEVDQTLGYTRGLSCKHDFGHCNTVDYNRFTDCLILGNGSGEYGTEGKFYVIPEAHKIAERQTNAIADIAIEYDCSAYNFGDKLNACWGYSNGGRHDIAILITNDNKNIRFVQLGKGANNLGYGNFIQGKDADEFNGSFKVCNEYVLDDGTQNGNPVNCNQGSDYDNGILYISVGHEPHRHWEISFQPDGKVSYTEVYEALYGETGEAAKGATEGMCITDNYMLTMESTTYGDNSVITFVCRKRK